jgi:hypothetical protein
MKYTAIDGTILDSNPNQPVTHTCNSNEFPDGIYESFETTSALNQYGIKQIKIVKTVENNIVSYAITESTNAELEAYLESLKPINNGN